MSKLNERSSCIEQLIEFAQDSGAIGALVVFGDDNTPSSDLRIAAVPADSSTTAVAYTRLSYIAASELDITASQVISRDDNLRAKKFELADGIVLTLCVTPLNNVGKDGWYRIVWDDMNAAATLGSSVPEDILCDLAPAPAAEPEPAEEPEMTDDFDDITEEEDIAEAPAAEDAAPEEPAADSDSEVKEYVDFISRNLKNAQRAIASGQLIRAGEIVSVLRKMAIELICVRNGVDSNFEQSIDFIDCEEKHMLVKTYPRSMDQKNMVVALGTLSELFDRLI